MILFGTGYIVGIFSGLLIGGLCSAAGRRAPGREEG